MWFPLKLLEQCMVLTKESSPFYPWSHPILSHPSFFLKLLSFPNNQGHDKVVSALSLCHQMQPEPSQSPCLVRLKINFSGIPVISSLYVLWAGRICPCVLGTWVVPLTHQHRATEVQTRIPPYGHVAGGTANARWRYREGTAPVRWTCLRCGIFCVRFGASEARWPQETGVAGTVAAESLSDPNQPQETQNLRRNAAAAPNTQKPQHLQRVVTEALGMV